MVKKKKKKKKNLKILNLALNMLPDIAVEFLLVKIELLIMMRIMGLLLFLILTIKIINTTKLLLMLLNLL